MHRLLLALVFFCIVPISLLRGQATTAQVTGTVNDPSGSPVAQATVTVTNLGTQVVRTTNSNDTGNFTVGLLSPGNYSITVQKPGFRQVTRPEVTLQVDQTARIDFDLQLGDVSQNITVSAQAPLLDQESSSLGQVVNSKQVVDLPLNGRSPFRLVQLTPGILSVPSTNGQFSDIPVNTSDDSIISINGGRAKTNGILIDGVPASAGFGTELMTYIPTVDATQEFKVQSSNLPAQFGRLSGGVINVATRSGTNQVHGTLFEFLRNTKLNANEFFNKSAGQSVPAFHMNQFGFALGGPVYLPKLYNGRDKTFFFSDYQATKWVQNSTFLTTIPTAAQRAGDFSQTRNAAGALVPIYNSFTTRANPASPNAFIRDPFPGNQLPQSLINPVAARMMTYFPDSNTPGTPNTAANNFISGAPRRIDQGNFDIRVDHNYSDRERLFGRFGGLRSTLGQPDYFNNVATPGVGALGKLHLNNYAGVLASTTTLSPTKVLDLRYGFARFHWDRLSRSYGFDQTTLGFPSSLTAQQQVPVFPTVNIGGYSGMAGSNFLLMGLDTHSLLASISQLSGRHNLKYGIEMQLHRLNNFQLNNGGGLYTFDNVMTRGPNPNVSTANAGNAIASMLLGTATSGSIASGSGYSLQNFYYGGYVQDDIRVSDRLTLNLGLRYEVESPYTERRNQINYFDSALVSPARNSAFPNLTGGLVFATPDNRQVYAWDKNNFSPRAGFAYTAFRHTVVRGGGGLFYSPLTVATSDTGFSPNSGFSTTTAMLATQNGITPFNLLANPYPSGINPISGNTLGARTNLGQNISVWDNTPAVTYNVQWNFDIQQQLPGGLLVDIAYTGNRGVKLTQARAFNALDPTYLGLGSGLQTLVPNPFFGQIATGPLSAATVQRQQLLLPYPQYTGLTVVNDTSGNSIYHAFNLKVEQRLRSGFRFLFAYTASKLIADTLNSPTTYDNPTNAGLGPTVQNPYNLRAERSVSELDVPRNLQFNALYELPFGPGKPFLASAHGLVARLVSGWQVGGILSYRSGYPLVLSASVVGGGNRPNSTGEGATLSNDRPRAQKIAEWFETTAFTNPAPFTYGNVSRTLPNVRGPALTNLDLTVLKDTRIKEQVNLQFRAEAFNAPNTPHLWLPNTNINNVQFGQISSTTGNPRVMQLALKLLF